jgi:cellulose synthase/poly-beta-1,6-N-acetylglucosamine synthase-like glycosyltransferase
VTPGIMAAEILFWLSASLVLYVYAGYPAVLVLLRRFFERPVRKAPIQPFVSLLIPVFNEADVIEAKIRNAASLDYPAERLEIVVASDGSTDGSVGIAARLADGRRVRVLSYAENRGKIRVFNESVAKLGGEIIVFSDAAAMLAPDSIRRLVANFADPEVGAVSGVYKVIKAEDAELGKSEDLYWKYEAFLKAHESAVGSVLGAHGHLHAVRRALYPFPEPSVINDDYVIPLRVVQKGYRAVYEPEAVVYEEAREMSGFGRRIRIMAGNLQQLAEIKALLRPGCLLPLFFFLSHKAGRLLVPFAMIAAAASNLLLAPRPFYLWLLRLQLAFYALAALGAVRRLRPRALRLPYYFCMIHAAAFAGLYHALTGLRRLAWK